MSAPIEVLIVDDDDDVRTTLALILESEGFRVKTAEHGRRALDKLPALDPPAVVLLDLRMPIMSGWEFIDTLRDKGRLDKAPIVICTSAPEDAPPGFPVVPKPVDLDGLVEVLKQSAM